MSSTVVEVHEDDGPGLIKMVAGLRRLKAGDWQGVVSDYDIDRPDMEEMPEDEDIYTEIAYHLVSTIVARWSKVAIRNAKPKVAAALRGLSEVGKAALLAWVRGGD